MNSETTSTTEYEVILIDDGTLDTVVSVEGTEYRYMWDPSADEEMTYGDFVEWALKDSVEQYEMEQIPSVLDENGEFSFEKFAALVNSGVITISQQNMFEPEVEE